MKLGLLAAVVFLVVINDFETHLAHGTVKILGSCDGEVSPVPDHELALAQQESVEGVADSALCIEPGCMTRQVDSQSAGLLLVVCPTVACPPRV
ncbi:Hypothetical protein CpE19_0941 [Corynebacterium pseudotuberculosis]|nr:Hypothetical protein CpE19_0941 [Corynebacterium pseudotuberculosis]ATD14545.1 hypothetical protein ATN04_10910 [Corynebacterium pseudotuberculosis]